MLRKFAIVIAASWACQATAAEHVLSLADPAPKLDVQEFVAGAPISQLETGKTYVVDFWATWSEPCRESIPHLSELQKQHPEVIFIGVSVDDDAAAVQAFVKKLDRKLAYRLALEKKLPDAELGVMSTAWLEASEQDGIPTAFLINRDGKVAWIGHPLELDEPLGKVLAGKWDLAAEAKQYAEDMTARRQLRAVQQTVTEAAKTQDYAQAFQTIEKAFAERPALENELAVTRLWLLLSLNKSDQSLPYAKRLADDLFKDDPSQLLALAGVILHPADFTPVEAEAEAETETPRTNPAKVGPELLALALRVAERTHALFESPDIQQRVLLAETLAAAYTVNGKKEQAAEILKSSVASLEETVEEAEVGITRLQWQLQGLNGSAGAPPDPKNSPARQP